MSLVPDVITSLENALSKSGVLHAVAYTSTEDLPKETLRARGWHIVPPTGPQSGAELAGLAECVLDIISKRDQLAAELCGSLKIVEHGGSVQEKSVLFIAELFKDLDYVISTSEKALAIHHFLNRGGSCYDRTYHVLHQRILRSENPSFCELSYLYKRGVAFLKAWLEATTNPSNGIGGAP